MKKRRGKSTQEGKFVAVDARYSGHLIAAAGELLSTTEKLPTVMSREAN